MERQMASLEWALPLHQPKLELGDIHVWRVSLHNSSAQAQQLYYLLADDEVNRAQRYYFSQDRDNFIIVRGLLRMLLGAYLRTSPQEIKLQYGINGKPQLAAHQPNTTINFNLSHSHELALLAFTYNQAIGVDVEYIRPEIVREQIAERYFSAQERETLRVLPNDLQTVAFFDCWTRKEAFIKATGEGLSRPLDQFSMSLFPGESARLLHVQEGPQEISTWHIQELEVGAGYRAALVVKKPVKRLYCWEKTTF